MADSKMTARSENKEKMEQYLAFTKAYQKLET